VVSALTPKRSSGPLDRWLTALSGRSPRIEPNFQYSGFRTVPSDWSIPLRVMTDHLIYFIVNGMGEGKIGAEQVVFEPGNLLWVPAGVVHEFWTRSGSPPITLYHIRFRLYEPRPRGVRYRLIQNAWELRPNLEQIVDELQSPGPLAVLRLRGLLTILFSSILRMQSPALSGGIVFNSRQRRIVTDYMREQIGARPTPAGLAAELRLSHDYFSRVFRRTFGVAPRTWFLRERIRSASLALIESRLTIKEIAFQHGYEDLYLFSRQFKQVLGVGPRAFRKQHYR
jgi:AraC-like DNA-binding protein